jgi:2-oxoglutarate dehydrogenase E2 component (dihydrolipoamide succinyltransferase)
VPVVRDADTKRLRRLSGAIADLAERARGRTLGADELAGGTLTITNPGPFGTVCSLPISNQPQVAIVVTDRVRREPVVVRSLDGTEGIGVHALGTLGLSFDQRVVGLETAAGFLARAREVLETRDWSQEL